MFPPVVRAGSGNPSSSLRVAWHTECFDERYRFSVSSHYHECAPNLVPLNRSGWILSSRSRYPSLADDIRAQVCVIGAGIAGMSVAYNLTREGKWVVVIDDGPVAAAKQAGPLRICAMRSTIITRASYAFLVSVAHG